MSRQKKNGNRPALSLPARIALAVASVLVVTTVLADLMAIRELRHSLAESVSRSLSGTVTRMAEQLDGDLAAMLDLVRGEAELIGTLAPEEADEQLRRRAASLGLSFDYGVILVDDAGTVTADSLGRDWSGVSLADEEFFQRTFARREGLVSEPFASPLADARPVAMATTPVLDDAGRVRAVLAGGLDLRHNRVVNQPTGMRTGRNGQFGIFTLDGTVVAHGDRNLLLQRFENPLPEGAVDNGILENGGAVTVWTRTADGHPALLAVSGMRRGGWLLAGVFSRDELFAPIEVGFAAAHRWFALGLGISCVLLWLIARWGVRDLDLLAGEIASIGVGFRDGGSARVGAGYRGEAGRMAEAVNAMLDSLAEARRDIDELSTRLARAGERERREIAADLHDSVCQNLALANMRLGGLKKRLGAGRDAEEAGEVRDIVEASVRELRNLTFSLSPGIVYELGVGPALEWYGGEFARKYAMPVEVAVDEDFSVPGLDEDRAMFLYRAAGELMTNAAKHSGGTAIRVELAREGGEAVLRVMDDGKGFDESGDAGIGFGLRHVRERARQFGGRVETGRGAGGGATVVVRMPS